MFTSYDHLNEGGCTDNEKKCSDRKLFEGTNPKTGAGKIPQKRWTASQAAANVNSQWEKLRK